MNVEIVPFNSISPDSSQFTDYIRPMTLLITTSAWSAPRSPIWSTISTKSASNLAGPSGPMATAGPDRQTYRSLVSGAPAIYTNNGRSIGSSSPTPTPNHPWPVKTKCNPQSALRHCRALTVLEMLVSTTWLVFIVIGPDGHVCRDPARLQSRRQAKHHDRRGPDHH